jgi:hypothetical protein
MYDAHVIRPTWKALWLSWFIDVLAAGNVRLLKQVYQTTAEYAIREPFVKSVL